MARASKPIALTTGARTKEEIQALADKACKVIPKKVRYYAPLCHRKHMNHSAEFYTEVERVYPDYRKWNKWLKEHGEIIMRNRCFRL